MCSITALNLRIAVTRNSTAAVRPRLSSSSPRSRAPPLHAAPSREHAPVTGASPQRVYKAPFSRTTRNQADNRHYDSHHLQRCHTAITKFHMEHLPMMYSNIENPLYG